MAKKNEVVEKTVNQTNLFNVGGEIGLSDVLSIVTSRAEEKFNNELQRCTNKAEELENLNAVLRQSIVKAAEKEIRAKFADEIKALRTAAKVFGCTPKFFFSGHNNRHNDGSAIPTDNDDMLVLSMNFGNGRYCDYSVTCKPSKDLVAKDKEYQKTAKEVEALNAEAFEWSRKLQNIPMLERKYKAKIAQTRLAESGNKQANELLEVLTANLDEDIANMSG